MRHIEYYVAISIDGFICGPNEDVSGFVQKGSGIDQYLSDLQQYDTVIMGRKTYEFGFNFGMKPGALAYPHMKHYVFSSTLNLEEKHEDLIISKLDLDLIDKLKGEDGTDIYLCGGGMLASWLLENEKIDSLKIKLNPFVQGAGVKLFSNAKTNYKLQLINKEEFDEGLVILTYTILYT